MISALLVLIPAACSDGMPKAGLPASGHPVPTTTSRAASITSGASSSSGTVGKAPHATVPTTTATARSPAAETCRPTSPFAGWSTPRLAAQLLVAPVEEGDVAAAQPLVADGIGGLLLLGSGAPSNLGVDIRQVDRSALGGISPVFMADEEGGGIQRLADLVGSLPWPRFMAQTMSAAGIEASAHRVGLAMRSAGVRMDLAPVLDLSDGPGPNARYADGERSFSIDPTVAAADGLAFARGLMEAGVTPVVKHFPGLGQATYNTDFGPAEVPPLTTLQTAALVPFRAAIAAGVPAIMVSNAGVPGLTGGLPVSLSAAAVTGLLRRTLGFKGLIVTDSLSADAVSDAGYSLPSAAVAAISAGSDLLIYNSITPVLTAEQMIDAIASAVVAGRVTLGQLRAAAAQVLAAKGIAACR
jgi:beta-N-acetylhexosaminidase